MRSRFDDYPWPPFGRPRPAPIARPRVERAPEPVPLHSRDRGPRPPSEPPPRPSDDVVQVEPASARATPTPEPVPSKAADNEKLQRALEDLAAAESRVERNAQRVYEESRSKLALELLPVLDNLDRTLQAADPADPIATGVSMVRAQLEAVLVRYGIERVDAAGKAFDPAEHEAVLGVPVEDEAFVGMVVEQVAPGYRLGTRLLRPAKVQVGMKAEPPLG